MNLRMYPGSKRMILRRSFCVFGLLIGLTSSLAAQQDNTVDFSRDIRPILSDTCFKCHGPDAHTREADLRFDKRESVFDSHDLVVPGNVEDSELFERLIIDDTDMLMPPPESGRSLTAEQIELIRRWIEQGANWGEHWSLVSPVKPPLPDVTDGDWVHNEIDYYILRQLENRDLSPSPEADRRTLARRLSLDLTGLPPTPAEVQSFLDDPHEDAYERYVDSLLASERYGEHMTRYWLDVVRYADTHGLHLDNYREHWPYRDWIINAFNSNQSFDRFSTEQLAGDLMDGPTRQQLIATGFNRSHVTTAEGGSIKKEVQVRNVVDRTSTFGTVFLGLTLGCATCHDHKFDPVSQEEYYSLYAYFNSLDGDPMDGNVKDHAPSLMVGSDEQMARLSQLDTDINSVTETIRQQVAGWQYVEPDDPPTVDPLPVEEIWIDDELPVSDIKHGPWITTRETDLVHQGKVSFVHEAKNNEQYFIQNVKQPWIINENDELFVHVYLDPDAPPREIMLQWNDGSWDHRAFWGEDLINWGKKNSPARLFMGALPRPGQWVRLSVMAADVNLRPGQSINGVALTQFDGKVYWDSIGRLTKNPPYPANRSLADWIDEQLPIKGEKLPGPVKSIFATEHADWTDEQKSKVQAHFIEHVYADSRETFSRLHSQKGDLDKQRKSLKNAIPTTLIFRETDQPRDAFFLNRGMYDQPKDKVERSVPAVFPPLPESDRNDRLTLAHWLFSDQHPLTARVAVNRFWQQVFGTGIVETPGDFGAQGAFPSHPDLLDFLAVDFRENGWNVKRLMKQLVMTSTYRQSSATSPELLKMDPDNRYFTRGRRHRLDAEVLRDQALFVGQLLHEKIGGPSVKPPQPDGLWFVVGYSGSNTVRFKKDEGHESVHRRSMYTFWKRTAPAPQMSILDAPSREVCTVRRERTNTPLQALLLMNDPQYIEAARYLAQLTIDQADDETGDRVRWMFERCLARPPTATEGRILSAAADTYAEEFSRETGSAKKLIAIGEKAADEKYTPVELATWTLVANLIMNMDEFITKN